MTPRKVVERYLEEVLVLGDPDAAVELIGNPVLRQRVDAFRGAFPDLALTLRHIVAEGPVVAVDLTAKATHTGPFQGVPATGRAWTATCSAFYLVDTDRIVDFWITWDLLTILEQIGGVERTALASA